MSTPPSINSRPAGTGGFLEPNKIVAGFGIKEGTQISDFGSGAGYFTISLAEKVGPGGKVHAFDVLENALDNVMAKARLGGINNIEVMRTDLEAEGGSGLTGRSQDFVLLANILFQSRKKENILKEAVRVLADGGRLVVIDWKKGTGGFGPPDDLRLDQSEIKKIAGDHGLVFDHDIDAGKFHFGSAFKKSGS